MGRLVDGTLNPSVIYSSYLQQVPKQVPLTRPAPLSELAADWLKRGGVDKVVVGHQPVGDAPLVMKAHGIEVRAFWVLILLHYRWNGQSYSIFLLRLR